MKDIVPQITFGIVLVLSLIMVLVITLLPRPPLPDFSEPKHTKNSIEYRVFEVEGMPCMGIGSVRQYGYAGLSCDWSKWEGK